MHISFTVRPGSFFVHGLLASIGMPRIAAGDHFLAEWPIRGGVLPLGPSSLQISTSGGGLLIKVLTRAAGWCRHRCIIGWSARQNVRCSRTSKTPGGGYCLKTGVYWRYDLTAQEQSRFYGSSKSVRGVGGISISVLEPLDMIGSAVVLVSSCADRPSATGDCVLLRGDNETAVDWVRRCRGGLEPRSGALTCLLGVLEFSSR